MPLHKILSSFADALGLGIIAIFLTLAYYTVPVCAHLHATWLQWFFLLMFLVANGIFEGWLAALLFINIHTMTIDVAAATYKLSCGFFPFKVDRSGNLSEFKQVSKFQDNPAHPYYLYRSTLPQCFYTLEWRSARFPYNLGRNDVYLVSYYDAPTSVKDPEEFGQQLAAKLGLPFISKIIHAVQQKS